MAMITPNDAALQHGPRPLPLFLSMLWQQTENDPETRQFALQGLRRYQQVQRQPYTHPPPHFVAGERAAILHLSPDGPTRKAPVVLVASLVNPAHILDLGGGMSLGAYLAGRGHDVWLIDWGSPSPEDADMGLAGHVEKLLLPLIAQLDRPPIVLGYCLGGTLAIAAAQLCRARALAAIATPWDFSAYPDDSRGDIAALWAQHRGACEQLGMVPMEVMQSGFWNLDPARTIRKYAAYARFPEGSAAANAFVTVEDWANEGAPLTLQAGRDLFEKLYQANETASGHWRVGGEVISLDALHCPTLSAASPTDRIVPAGASPVLAEHLDLSLGHVGMIVSRRAPEMLWRPLSDWIARHEGGA